MSSFIKTLEQEIGELPGLPLATQEAIKQLACLGESASVEILTMVHGGSEEDLHEDLRQAVEAQLVLRLEGSYQFSQAQFRKAAYALIPEESRPKAHLRLGRLLYSRMTPEQVEE